MYDFSMILRARALDAGIQDPWFLICFFIAWWVSVRRVAGVPASVLYTHETGTDVADTDDTARIAEVARFHAERVGAPRAQTQLIFAGAGAFVLAVLLTLSVRHGLPLFESLAILYVPVSLSALLEVRACERIANAKGADRDLLAILRRLSGQKRWLWFVVFVFTAWLTFIRSLLIY